MQRVNFTYRKRLQEELKRCEAKLKTQTCPHRRIIMQEHITYLKYHIKHGIKAGENSIACPVSMIEL